MTRMERIDWWLNRKVFTRIADWADYHFNRNHYDLAIYMLMAQLLAMAIQIALMLMERSWWLAVFDLIVLSGQFIVNRSKIEQLEICSRKYDYDSVAVPSEAVRFFATSAAMRLVNIAISVLLGFLVAHIEAGWFRGALAAIGFSWIMWTAFCDYFAMSIRPPKTRQKKKAPDFSGALQPSPVSS